MDFEDAVITPVKIKPLGKRVHREISFPSGINVRNDERPVMRKVQSVPITEGYGLRSLSPESLGEDDDVGEEPHRVDLVIRDHSEVSVPGALRSLRF